MKTTSRLFSKPAKTNYGTIGTTGTCFRITHISIMVSLSVHLFRHAYYFFFTNRYTDFTTFTGLCVNYYRSLNFCHILNFIRDFGASIK